MFCFYVREITSSIHNCSIHIKWIHQYSHRKYNLNENLFSETNVQNVPTPKDYTHSNDYMIKNNYLWKKYTFRFLFGKGSLPAGSWPGCGPLPFRGTGVLEVHWGLLGSPLWKPAALHPERVNCHYCRQVA